MRAKTPPVIRPMEEAAALEVERSRGAFIQILLGPDDHVPNFATRRFTLMPGGRIPCHSHDAIEHEQVVLEGEMTLGLDDAVHLVRPGDCVFIPARTSHWYENRGEEPVKFLCMVPVTDAFQTTWLEDPAD